MKVSLSTQQVNMFNLMNLALHKQFGMVLINEDAIFQNIFQNSASGRSKNQRGRGAISNARYFYGKSFAYNSTQIWVGGMPPCSPVSTGPAGYQQEMGAIFQSSLTFQKIGIPSKMPYSLIVLERFLSKIAPQTRPISLIIH